MKKVEIFDPAMCCTTGVCGPSIDPELLRMATVINSLKEKGILIERHNLANEPQCFVDNKLINKILQEKGAEVLPVTLVDGNVIKTKSYPSNSELAEWLGVNIEIKQMKKDNGCCCNTKGKC